MEYDDYLELIGTATTGRFDLTPLFQDTVIYAELRSDLLANVSTDPTLVCGIDALGFVLGSAVAIDLGVGFSPIRKGGKLPYPDDRLFRREVTDYSETEKALELREGAIEPSDRVLLVDDWIETGAQMEAATDLVEATGATVSAITAINALRTDQTEALFEAYDVYSIA